MSKDSIAKITSELKVLAMTHDSREELLYAYETIAHGLPAEQTVHELRCEDFNKLFAVIDALPDEEVSGLIDSVGLDVEAVEAAGHQLVESFVRDCKISASFEAQTPDWRETVYTLHHSVQHSMIVGVGGSMVIVGSPSLPATNLPVCIRGWRRFRDRQFRHDKYGGYYVETDGLRIEKLDSNSRKAIECDDPILSLSARDICALKHNSAVSSATSFGPSRNSTPKKSSRNKGDKRNNEVM